MIALLQRVTSARVEVGERLVGQIGLGVLAFVGVRPADTESSASRLLHRLLKYRIFGDDQGKMNLSLQQIQGGLLLVPQFTLAADTRHGLRPGFSTAANPDLGRRLFDGLLKEAQVSHANVAAGEFGADMRVTLVNDGPVTFWLES